MIIKNKYTTYRGYDFEGKFRIHSQEWTAPDAAAVATIHAAVTLASLVTTTVTTSITNPDFARVLSITGTKAGGSLTGNVVITGQDIRGNVISNTIALNDNATVVGTKAFKTVTSIMFPARVTAGDTVSVGISDLLGLECIPDKAVAIKGYNNGALEGTLPTIVAGATIGESTIDFDTACNASRTKTATYYTGDQTAELSRTA